MRPDVNFRLHLSTKCRRVGKVAICLGPSCCFTNRLTSTKSSPVAIVVHILHNLLFFFFFFVDKVVRHFMIQVPIALIRLEYNNGPLSSFSLVVCFANGKKTTRNEDM